MHFAPHQLYDFTSQLEFLIVSMQGLGRECDTSCREVWNFVARNSSSFSLPLTKPSGQLMHVRFPFEILLKGQPSTPNQPGSYANSAIRFKALRTKCVQSHILRYYYAVWQHSASFLKQQLHSPPKSSSVCLSPIKQHYLVASWDCIHLGYHCYANNGFHGAN